MWRRTRQSSMRVLVAQAQIERATVITADRAFAAYDVPVLWAGQ